MGYTIEDRFDERRGCGYRKPGGLYLVSAGIPTACDLLPIPLSVCPTCHGGIKAARGWTTIDIYPLLKSVKPCSQGTACPLASIEPGDKSGLLWIGEVFYPTPDDWLRESNRLGVSRRISQIPKDLEVGKTWVFVAHRSVPYAKLTMVEGEMKAVDGPAIFHAFRPTAVEYVVKGNESDDELEALAKRGITLVKVTHSDMLPGLVVDASDGDADDEDDLAQAS